MQRLQKIAYFVGIGIAVSVFFMVLYSFLPMMIQNNQWDNLDGFNISEEELLKRFQAEPAYLAFYAKYPDAKEELNYNRHGGSMQVGAVNFEKNNTLRLHLNYNDYDERINVNVNCETQNNTERNMYADGLFAIDFINQTNCLDLESSSETNGDIRTITKLPNGVIRLD